MDSNMFVFGLLSIGFGIFGFALFVRLWRVLDDIRKTCLIIQRIAKKYPEEKSDVQQPPDKDVPPLTPAQEREKRDAFWMMFPF